MAIVESKLAEAVRIKLIQQGVKESFEYDLPDDAKEIVIKTKRKTLAEPTIWADNDNFIEVFLYILIDGVWKPLSGFTTNGGAHLTEKGLEETHNIHEHTLGTDYEGRNRKIKVVFKNLSGTPPELTYDIASK